MGQRSILCVKFDDGGNYRYVSEDYFILWEGTVLLLDFAPVFQAATKVVPAGKEIYQPTLRFDVKSLVVHVQTEESRTNVSPKVDCCQGRVDIPFHIRQWRVQAGDARYYPD